MIGLHTILIRVYLARDYSIRLGFQANKSFLWKDGDIVACSREVILEKLGSPMQARFI